LVASALAVDNVATVLYLTAMFLIPASPPDVPSSHSVRDFSENAPVDVQPPCACAANAPDGSQLQSAHEGREAARATSPSSQGGILHVRALAEQLSCTLAVVVVAWGSCMAGRFVAVTCGAPAFELALVAAVADAAGSLWEACLARWHSSGGILLSTKASAGTLLAPVHPALRPCT
jgi:hypothetical protein